MMMMMMMMMMDADARMVVTDGIDPITVISAPLASTSY